MRLPCRTLLTATVLIPLAACRSMAGAASPSDVAANRAISQQFAKCVIAQDWDTISRLYAEDAVLYPPNQPPVSGREAIRAFFTQFPPVDEFVLTDEAVEVSGDLASCRGRYTVTWHAAGSPKETGRYLDVRRRQADGSWKYVADMASSDASQEQ